MEISANEDPTFLSALSRQRNVVFALMLRNIRTRFFAHGLGYLIAIGWPLVHTLSVLLIFASAGRASPYGTSTFVFVASGAVPFMTFSYLSRFMMVSALMTKPLMTFPEVKILDIVISSTILEALSSCLVALILIAIAWGFDIDASPRDAVEASYAFAAALLLGVGFGVVNTVIVLAQPMWMTGYSLLMILAWASSSTMFVANALPEPFRTAISYHPVAQVIEWMRYAYFEGYSDEILDRAYVLEVGIGALVLGLLFERLVRGFLLAAK